MLSRLYSVMSIDSPVSVVIISVALMLFLGFAMTRITKLFKLPNVTAYILTGILIGPYCLNLIPQKLIDGTDFLADIALAFISFGVGEFFKLSSLRKNGPKVAVIMLFEAAVASISIFILTYFILRLNMAFSIVLSALASATAPASTVMTINQTRSKGDFVDTLLQTIALDDVFSLIAYSVTISIALTSVAGGSQNAGAAMVLKPIIINIGIVLLGCAFGCFLKWLMPKKRSTDNRLIISVSLLFAFCGICAVLDVSPLLGCMSMGMVYINITQDDKLFMQLNYFSPPILLLFFVRSGLNFRLDSLVGGTNTVGGVPLLAVSILYFLVRIAGKYFGAFAGCAVVKKSKAVRNYLGLALIPQAGVSIGLADLGARILGGSIGSDLQTVVVASGILYEIIGPALAKLSLYKTNSYSDRLEDITEVPVLNASGQPKPPVEVLIDRIRQIQSELKQQQSQPYGSEEEKAFTQAAEEQYEVPDRNRRGRFLNRR